MEETRDLVPVEQKPKDIVEAASDAAKKLKEIVDKHKRLVLGGSQYLFFEDWQTVGRFYGVTAKVISSEEIKEGGNLVGFLSHAEAVHNGVAVSAADAECTYDEPNWAKKPRFQLRSMAQTRACAKALRNCLGWVVTLAGYSATPAEEMVGEISQDKKQDKPKTRTAKPQEAENENPNAGEYEPKELRNLGDFFSACNKRWGLTRTEVEAKIGKSALGIIDIPAEWENIKKIVETGE